MEPESTDPHESSIRATAADAGIDVGKCSTLGRAGLICCAVLQAAFLIWLFVHGRDAVALRIRYPDTPTYTSATLNMLETGALPLDMSRTIGYPLFLLLPFWIGGEEYGCQLAVVLQSVLTLLGVFVFWKFLTSILPNVRAAPALIATAIFWCAAFGLALNVLSDFIFGFFLLLFFYAFWLKRGARWLALGLGALLAATLTRPVCGPFILILPLLRILVNHRCQYLPRAAVAAYGLAIIFGSAVNFSLEQTRASRMSESFVSWSVQASLSQSGIASQSEVTQRVEALAGRPYDELVRSEVNSWNRQVFLEFVLHHRVQFMSYFAVNFGKYIFSPIEGVALKVAVPDISQAEAYLHGPLRRSLVLLGAPIWLLAVWPGMARRPETRDAYIAAMVITFYFVGFASAFAGGGERHRFPALPMLLICFANSSDRLVSLVRFRRIGAARAAGI